MLLHPKHKQLGLSLIEAMLAITIGMGMVTLGIRQYQTFNADKDVQQVQANLDILFQAMSLYSKANCTTNWDYNHWNNAAPTQHNPAGTLDPSQNPANPFPLVDNAGTLITTLLVTPKYLTKWPLLPTAYVDSTAANNGYVLQFNLVNSYFRNSPTSKYLKATDGTYPQMGNIYYWQAQVSALVRHTANVSTYQQLLGADCRSSLDGSGVTVYPCSANKPGNYLVWTRLPSGALHQSNSVLWQTTPQLNQFKEQYTHDTYYEFNNTHSGFPNWAQTQYYLCGG